MSIVPKEAIEVIAQTVGINNLSPDVALALAPDIEFRMREIIQEAIKCMRHSRRTVLTGDDVDSAVQLRNIEPIYGFTSRDSLRFKKAAGHKDLYYIDERDLEFKDVIEAPLPKAPLDTSITAHWLAIEGIQPAIPENAPVEEVSAPSDGRRFEYKEDGSAFDIKMPIYHVLSKEIQLYFRTITELTVKRSNSALFNKAVVSLATDAGLNPLMPYFTCFIADEVTRNLNNFMALFALMRVARSLVQNPHMHIEPYLHQLMPCIITCLIAKRLGNRLTDNHWDLRNFAANIIAMICKRYGLAYHSLQPRVTKTLLHAFLDPTEALPQHYGAIQGLAALGPSVVRLLILPNLEPYLQLLEPEMILDNQKNDMKKLEAWRVYGALVHAIGLCMNDRRRIFTSLLSPPKRSIWKGIKRVIMPNKRKASTDNLMHQPPLKRMAMEGPMGMMPVSSSAGDMQVAAGSGLSNVVGSSTVGMGTMHNQLQNENMSGREVGVGGQILKKSSVSAQTSKLRMNSGHLMASLLEHFGESLSSFIPKPESSFFL